MCVVCNAAIEYSDSALLAVSTDSNESFTVPIVRGLIENHSFETIQSLLIKASLVGIIF
ncbi:MAG: hypothetical protein ACJ0GW_01065 [Candidatus Actinomarina sp.]|tara:strand:- start:1325 stop:1501 length:177 start_codon:yes stop_codon:yes gene_type:complete